MKFPILILVILFSMPILRGQTAENRKSKTATFNCYFEYNSAVFPSDSLAKMDGWLKPYLSNYSVVLNLAAFTDTIGSEVRNQALAERRFKSVNDHLIKNQIAVNEVTVIGENYPKTGYKKDKLFRKVQITLELEEKPVLVNKNEDPMLQHIKERMESFEISATPIVLDIQFVGGQDVYMGDSYLEVVALLQYLKNNPKKKAFIRGHVCCENDMGLSTRRALAVYNDLRFEGISEDRISYQGFGNTIPAVPELDEYSKQQNRRVDVIFSE